MRFLPGGKTQEAKEEHPTAGAIKSTGK